MTLGARVEDPLRNSSFVIAGRKEDHVDANATKSGRDVRDSLLLLSRVKQGIILV